MVQAKSSLELLKQWFGISTRLESQRKKQLIRHELLSVILAIDKPVYKWLSQAKANFNIALLAVLGHHLKVKDGSYFEIASDSLRVFTDAEDFQKILQLGCEYLGLDGDLPKFPKKFDQSQLKDASYKLGGHKDSSFVKIDKSYAEDLDKLKEIAVVEALVIAADLAASALLEKERGDRSYKKWIKDA